MKSRGFTLIELLIALVILALISLAAYRGLDAVLQTRTQLAAETRKWQHLALFFARLEQDIAQAVHRSVRDEGGVAQAEWLGHAVVVGDNDAALIFTRAGIADASSAQLAPQRIGYRLEHGAIVQLHWPALDQPQRANPTRNTVLEGVSEFKLRYLSRDGLWLAQWPPANTLGLLPNAAEVELTLNSGEKISRVFALQ